LCLIIQKKRILISALNAIRLALSKFLFGRNEARKNSLEAKLFDAATSLRDSLIKEDNGKESDFYEFPNELIHTELTNIIGWSEVTGQKAYYSPETGKVTHSKITRKYKSKLKAESSFVWDSFDAEPKRALKFSHKVLKRLGLYYDVPKEIEILTLLTEKTHPGDQEGVKNDTFGDVDSKNHAQIASDLGHNNEQNKALTLNNNDISVRSVRNYEHESVKTKHDIYFLGGKQHCRNCKQTGDKSYMTIERPYCDCSLK